MSVARAPAASAATSRWPAAVHDFDFLFGRWRVANRRLRTRLAGADDWETFEAEAETWPLLGGLGNREHFRTSWGGGYEGLGLRLFDLATQRWSIWWASDRSGTLEPPVTGGFEHGVGTFIGTDVCEGRAVLARFRWLDIGEHEATWEQALSVDEGRQWETNWVMQFRRIAAGPTP